MRDCLRNKKLTESVLEDGHAFTRAVKGRTCCVGMSAIIGRGVSGRGALLASTLSSKLTCVNYHRLGVVAGAGERGSRARNASTRKGS